LRDTFFAFVVIWLDVDSKEVIDYFAKNYKEKGWNVSLAKMSARDESPRRRKLANRRSYEREDYEQKKPLDRMDRNNSQLRYGHFRDRGREEYEAGLYRDRPIGEDYRDSRYRGTERKKSEDNDFPRYYSSSQKESGDEFRRENHMPEGRLPEPEKRIPCNSSSLKDPEAFARLLLLPSDVIQNVILQLANNNKQALVGSRL
jgi:hypothetical protein